MAAKIYALYKGERNLTDGTLAQIAHRQNVKIRTLYYMLSPTYKKRMAKRKGQSGGCLELVEIVDDEGGRQ